MTQQEVCDWMCDYCGNHVWMITQGYTNRPEPNPCGCGFGQWRLISVSTSGPGVVYATGTTQPYVASHWIQSGTGTMRFPLPEYVNEPEVELSAAPFVGGRVWLMSEGNPYLHSLNNLVWIPGKPATCEPSLAGARHRGDHVPAFTCTCGYWAKESLEDAREKATSEWVRRRCQHPMRPSSLQVAYGEVELWGRVVKHEFGWRGEYARPKSLHVFGDEDRLRRTIASIQAKYGTIESVSYEDDPADPFEPSFVNVTIPYSSPWAPQKKRRPWLHFGLSVGATAVAAMNFLLGFYQHSWPLTVAGVIWMCVAAIEIARIK